MSVVLMVTLAVTTVQDAGDGPDLLLKRMEAKIAAAKTVKVKFSSELTYPKNIVLNAEGVLQFGEKDQMRADYAFTGKLQSKRWWVSDGANVRIFVGKGPEKDRVCPEGAGKFARSAFSRAGFIWKLDKFSIPDGYFSYYLHVAEIKAVGKEKLGKVETDVVEYRIKGRDMREEDKILCKVWIDSKTSLPLKRLIRADVAKGEPRFIEMIETYTIQIDEMIDAKQFELSK